MKPTFIALLHELEITEDLGHGDKINDALRITNNRTVIERLLSPGHRMMMGDMEVASLLTGAPVVIAEADIPPDMTPQQYLLTRLYETQGFLMTTWVLFDNAVNCELGFLLHEKASIASATSNFVAHLYSTARGEKPVTRWTREQLREMRTLHREAMSMPDHPFQLPTSQLTSRHPRTSRAIFLINGARGQSDIAMKVSLYCTAFETLFSTSQAELAHQLSERLSCYLYETVDERLAHYRKVKAAYSLRSKVVHGSTLREEKLPDAVDAAEYCDMLARKVFYRLLTDKESQELFERDAQSFDEGMLSIIFSGKAA
jgi:hypothetical protein